LERLAKESPGYGKSDQSLHQQEILKEEKKGTGGKGQFQKSGGEKRDNK
jgi:hypothetical protein